MQTITTPYEVVRYSPAGRDYPTTNICPRIPIVEEAFWNNCFGEEMRDWMLERLTTYPVTATDWDGCKYYLEGDFVKRGGCTFESLANGNNTDPWQDDEEEFWQPLKKFTNECLNTLWENYLRGYFANKIYAGSLLYTTQNTQAGGLVIRAEGDRGGSRAGNATEIGHSKTALLQDAEDIYGNMMVWLKKNKEDCGFPEIKAFDCGTDGCATLNKPATYQWGFRRRGA